MDILLLKLFRIQNDPLSFFRYLIILKSSNEEVVFLKIEVDISVFPKSTYLLNSKFIWICKYYDEVQASA